MFQDEDYTFQPFPSMEIPSGVLNLIVEASNIENSPEKIEPPKSVIVTESPSDNAVTSSIKTGSLSSCLQSDMLPLMVQEINNEAKNDLKS